MNNENGIMRIEKYLSSKAELKFAENKIYNNGSVEETLNVWLDAMETEESEKLKLNTLKDYIGALVQLDIDLLKDGWQVETAIQEKNKYYYIKSPVITNPSDSKLISIFNSSIDFTIEQYIYEDEEFTCFKVDIKMSPEQELLFKMLDLDGHFGTNSHHLADIYYNGIESDYN